MNPKKTVKRMLLWFLLIMCLGIGAASGFALYIAQALQPTASGKAVRVTIPPGVDSRQIAEILQQHGIIRNADVFRYYLVYKKQGSKFQAGEYDMVPGMELDRIIDVLNNGETVKEEVIRFTIPEGFTVKQIAEKLSEQGWVDYEAFLEAAGRAGDYKSRATEAIPRDSRLIHVLEGYLFPETYELKKQSSETDIIGVMVKELDNKLAALPDGWQEQMNRLGLTLHEILTVASLIEREVVLDEERPLVASVIYNRLKAGQPLQIDATVQYLLDKPKERLLYEDLQIESPYNTYLHKGLPPGPIASPSLASIQAALFPAESNYFYYVTKKDGSNGHLFAETYEQHIRNIEESRKNQP